MSSKFKFKLSTSTSNSYPDAEALFRDLKNRDPQIQHLWSHQADIIREYHKNLDKSDIALELPTGTGKTLVGLLIAEWRRITKNERVAYLCPTKQLAYQVGQKAAEYGIKAHVLVGKQSEYPADKFADYALGKSIAITTYSGLFNINPKINNPELIILDDAHAGENYIAKMWSLSILRSEQNDLYRRIVDLYSDVLPEYLISILKNDNPDPLQKQSVDLLPFPKFLPKVQSFTELLDTYTQDNELYYAWQLIRDKLHACHTYFSWSEILIRPLVPPSLTHAPFRNAKQRLFMSATLGVGGELERITGIPNIYRIPVPPGWDKQSTGRRLFLFPDRNFKKNEYESWIAETINSNDRILVLAPNNLALSSFLNSIVKYDINHDTLKAQDVEESMDAFIENSKAILALTNRYDGIDLPGESCRVLIVYDLPASVNLQEKFLWLKLGLTNILRERVKTRITQAVGRCTRNSTDYALVIMAGEKLFDFCIIRETREELHPELRAEMDFGIDNSDVNDINDLTSLVKIFLDREDLWNEAETDIIKRRDETKSPTPTYLKNLQDIVNVEINYQYDRWNEDYESALSKATTIVDKLAGDELSGYRALWNYFSGCCAFYLGDLKKDSSLLSNANDRFLRASRASNTTTWFARLAQELKLSDDLADKPDYLLITASESMNNYLINLGTVGAKFEKHIKQYKDLISDSNANNFDRALTELGMMLGFETEKPSGQGVPDSIWTLSDNYILVFEAKSYESPDNGISISTCREAQGHISWIKSNYSLKENTKIVCIIVSPRKFVDKSALPHAESLYYKYIEDIRELFSKAENNLRNIRSRLSGLEQQKRLQLIQTELNKNELHPQKVIEWISNKLLTDLKAK